ncbi:MAG: hypothetical protein ABH824_05145 [Nanoarchaeota archaeon]|nr:hypothetical protein [Nanoarchaeota archaeon]MBU1632829.1 hypothetical protein [Nanoarchaeota archaeon]MBU1876478.1 hypothetical protein [Nanoarchaeota archaeon]
MKRHSDHIDDLIARVKKDYQIVMKEVDIHDPETRRTIGEADLIGIINGEWHLYEVKSGDNLEKAKKQLFKLKRYLEDYHDIKLFYYSGKLKEVKEIC